MLQNELTRRLPQEFLSYFPAGSEIAYSVIPQIPTLPEAFKVEVQQAFAGSIQKIWQVMIGLSGAGLLCVLLIKELKMHEVTDTQWGMDENQPVLDEEKGEDTKPRLP